MVSSLWIECRESVSNLAAGLGALKCLGAAAVRGARCSLAIGGMVWMALQSSAPALADNFPGIPLPAEYGVSYGDRTHGWPFDSPLPWYLIPQYYDLPTYLGSLNSAGPIATNRYFGHATSSVDPVTHNPWVDASVTGVLSAYDPLGAYASLDPLKPAYATHGGQFYSFIVGGGVPGTPVTIDLTASVLASGSGSYFADASVFMLGPAFGPFFRPFYPLFSASAADGVGLGASGIEPLVPANPFVPYSLIAGSVSGTGTIQFQVPAWENQTLWLYAVAEVYDQQGSTAYALVDPQIEVDPSTPNHEQYVVVQSSNITPVPEIDPQGLAAALSLLSGLLGFWERRRFARC